MREPRTPLRIRPLDAVVLISVLVVVLGVGWITATISRDKAENDRLQSQVSTLAQQVRQLGGVPRVTPTPGPTGGQGAQGPAGPAGAAGQPGRPGPAGSAGKQGSAGSPGPAGASGAPGSQGGTGPQGSAGPQGPAGPAGKDGRDGSPPTSWTWTYAGTTYTCVPDSQGATTYTCTPAPAMQRKGRS